MVELITLSGAGFLLGFRHAFEADHLAAVSTLATREAGLRGALRLGTAWGVGHTLSVAAAVVAVLLLDLELPAPLHLGAELLVAVLLVALGAWTLVRERRGDGFHGHDPVAPSPRGSRQSFGFGLVHGLAGSGSILVLLAATAGTNGERVASLVPFGAGTILGMLLVSVAVVQVTTAAAGQGRNWARTLRVVAAVASVGIGFWLGVETLA